MRFDKVRAFELRKQGKSYKEISQLLGMSLSTLSDWFKNEPWSNEIKSRLASKASAKNACKLELMHKARSTQLKNLYEKARREAKDEYKKFRENPLFIAGLMIYWGEGDKLSKYRCSVANTEPKMIRIFVKFLVLCGVKYDRIVGWILLYPDLDASVCRNFWVKEAGLDNIRFTKSIIIKGKSTIKRLHYGVCNVGFHNRYFKEKMLIWFQLVAKDLV
ncbi:MAG: helix-turn-helix domain-containing protein [bacterium]|nr:helix-turn-helix domain-containing protein [bacterium]